MKYFVGLIVVLIGCAMVIKTEWFLENFGRSDWAEDKLGGGGTRLMYKLLGVLGIILAVLGVTGALGEIITSVFSSLFGGPQQ